VKTRTHSRSGSDGASGRNLERLAVTQTVTDGNRKRAERRRSSRLDQDCFCVARQKLGRKRLQA